MIQSSTQTNSTAPISEPNKVQPTDVGPQQTDAEKKALADKAKAEADNSVKA